MKPSRRGLRRHARLVVGVALLALCGVGVGYPLWWQHRSSSVGAVLLAKAKQARAGSLTCPANALSDAAPIGGPGILEIPSIGLAAPVEDGLGDDVLNVAVGHPTGTIWPSEPGEALLEAHDVSYFANLQSVHTGATVIWVTHCMKATFTVTGTRISYPGATIPTPASGSGLVLVTCYPTDALFWTSQRYVVTASLVSERAGYEALPKTSSDGTKLVVPAPPSLAATGLDLDADGNSIYLKTLAIAGSPSSAWREGPGPMQVEADALAVAFGAAKAIERDNSAWWSAITVPGLRRPSSWPLEGAAVDITITVKGSTPEKVTIASSSTTATFSITHDVIRLASIS